MEEDEKLVTYTKSANCGDGIVVCSSFYYLPSDVVGDVVLEARGTGIGIRA